MIATPELTQAPGNDKTCQECSSGTLMKVVIWKDNQVHIEIGNQIKCEDWANKHTFQIPVIVSSIFHNLEASIGNVHSVFNEVLGSAVFQKAKLTKTLRSQRASQERKMVRFIFRNGQFLLVALGDLYCSEFSFTLTRICCKGKCKRGWLKHGPFCTKKTQIFCHQVTKWRAFASKEQTICPLLSQFVEKQVPLQIGVESIGSDNLAVNFTSHF